MSWVIEGLLDRSSSEAAPICGMCPPTTDFIGHQYLTGGRGEASSKERSTHQLWGALMWWKYQFEERLDTRDLLPSLCTPEILSETPSDRIYTPRAFCRQNSPQNLHFITDELPLKLSPLCLNITHHYSTDFIYYKCWNDSICNYLYMNIILLTNYIISIHSKTYTPF